MTKIKLVDGSVINADSVELENGTLKIVATENTVEELAGLFSNTNNTSLITLMTESEIETGYKSGFTSFAGITYNTDGTKTIEMFQPIDTTEARIANAEATANIANNTAIDAVEQNEVLATTVDSILTDIIPSLLSE